MWGSEIPTRAWIEGAEVSAVFPFPEMGGSELDVVAGPMNASAPVSDTGRLVLTSKTGSVIADAAVGIRQVLLGCRVECRDVFMILW